MLLRTCRSRISGLRQTYGMGKWLVELSARHEMIGAGDDGRSSAFGVPTRIDAHLSLGNLMSPRICLGGSEALPEDHLLRMHLGSKLAQPRDFMIEVTP